MRGDLVEHYARLLDRHPWLRVALCWTVIEPVTAPVDCAEVVRRLGGDPGELRPRHPRTPDIDVDHDRECRYFVDQVGRVVTVLEFAGEGSRREVLRWLSDGARVHSAFWNADGVSRLTYAVYGDILTSLQVNLPDERQGSDPDALNADLGVLLAATGAGHPATGPEHPAAGPEYPNAGPHHADTGPEHLNAGPRHGDAGPHHANAGPDHAGRGPDPGRDDPARATRGPDRADHHRADAGPHHTGRGQAPAGQAGAGDWQAAMLAVIESRTGVPLDEAWPTRPHPAVVLPRLRADPRPPTSWVDPDLDAHLRLAPEPARRAARGWLLERLARTYGLTGEPAVVRGIAALAAGHGVDEDARRAGHALRDRLAAHTQSVAVGQEAEDDPRWRRAQAGWALAAALDPPPGEEHFEELRHARLALGESWPVVRAELRARLRGAR
ncbi:MAG TPA: DUF6461 domain-containing protein [Pilimelia sp.]|nr:DUF6461 domain-containing protein [Pilimelia sp.]